MAHVNDVRGQQTSAKTACGGSVKAAAASRKAKENGIGGWLGGGISARVAWAAAWYVAPAAASAKMRLTPRPQKAATRRERLAI